MNILRYRILLSTAIFVLAMLLRLGFLRDVRDLPTYRYLQSDEVAAHQGGVACLEGRMPPKAYLKAPLYTFFLAAIYRVSGPDPYYARVVQAVLCSLSAVLVYLIADRLFGRIAGLVAGLIGAGFWIFVLFAVELVDASLASLFYLLLAWILVVADRQKAWHWAIAGVVMGLGAITRPNVLIFAPVLGIAVFVFALKGSSRKRSSSDTVTGENPSPQDGNPTEGGRDTEISHQKEARRLPPNPSGSEAAPADTIGAGGTRPEARTTKSPMPDPGRWTSNGGLRSRFPDWRTALVNVLALTAACCAVIAPVTIRNRVVGGEWVLIAAYGGHNLWVGNNPYSDGKNAIYMVGEGPVEAASADPNDPWSDALGDRVARAHAESSMGRRLRRGEIDSFDLRLALQFIKDNPGRFMFDTLRRTCYLANAYEFATVRDPYLLCRFSSILNVLSYVHFGVLFPFLVVGFVMSARIHGRPPQLTYCLLMLVTMLIGGILFVVNSRFRVPLVYLGVPLAAYGVTQILALGRAGQAWSRRIGYGIVLVASAVLSNWDFLGYRPPYHTDLRFAETVACWHAKQRDRLAEAIPRFEEAFFTDMRSSKPNWATLIVHSRPYTLLSVCSRFLGDDAKAIHYGKQAMLKEPYDRTIAIALFEAIDKDPGLTPGEIYQHLEMVRPILSRHDPEVLKMCETKAESRVKNYFLKRIGEALAADGVDTVYRALEDLTPVLLRYDRNLLGDFYLLVGDRLEDERLLSEAVRIFRDLAIKNAGEAEYQQKLAEARESLSQIARIPSTSSGPARVTNTRPRGGRMP